MKIKLPLFILFLILSVFSPTSVFAQNEIKTASGILIDNTGSLRPQLNNVLIIGKAVVGNANQQTTVSLFNFETLVNKKNKNESFAAITPGTRWSQDKAALRSYIDGLYTVPGGTMLFDAILSAAKTIEEKAASDKLTDKTLILITDGDDRDSKIKGKKLIQEIKAMGIKVYAIGLVEELDPADGPYNEPSMRDKAKNFLNKITKETGGNAVFPKLKKSVLIADILTELFAEPVK